MHLAIFCLDDPEVLGSSGNILTDKRLESIADLAGSGLVVGDCFPAVVARSVYGIGKGQVFARNRVGERLDQFAVAHDVDLRQRCQRIVRNILGGGFHSYVGPELSVDLTADAYDRCSRSIVGHAGTEFEIVDRKDMSALISPGIAEEAEIIESVGLRREGGFQHSRRIRPAGYSPSSEVLA